MYKLKSLFILLIIVISQSCKGQDDTVYILFKNDESVDCLKPKTNKKLDTQTIDYKGIMQKSGETLFFIYQEKFIKEKGTEEIKITKADMSNINFVDYRYLYEENIKRDKFSKKGTFKDIYLVEQIDSETFIKHKVYWSN